MTRTAIVRGAIPLVLLAGAAVAPHAQAQPLTFRYVASAGPGSDLLDEAPVSDDTRPLGWFTFRSPGRFFTLKLDDVGTLTGARIPVTVVVNRTRSALCIPARTPTRLSSGRRGAEVLVFIDTAVEAELRCGGSGTTGIAYVT
ncbi:MAG TPA: hypothetical protein VNA30_07355 [Mycobacteriales bacterium]|nr:hypothetical protein [Mycobacteriales bacterium]